MKRIVKMSEYADRRTASQDHNEMILLRMTGIPSSPATAETEEDPRNPNVKVPHPSQIEERSDEVSAPKYKRS